MSNNKFPSGKYYYGFTNDCDDNGCVMYVSPVEYFNTEGCVYDNHIPHEEVSDFLYDKGWSQECECYLTMEYGERAAVSKDILENELLASGFFIKSKKFMDFIAG
jgi:hypothetical protein